jgi:hypothetical protein
MNKEQKNQLDILFGNQIKILKDIGDELDGELSEYLDPSLEKVEKIQKKILKLEKIKIILIKMYSTIVSEYQ